VSKSLLFEFDPLDQPAATEMVERQTWCALRIRVAGRFISRIWDKKLESERTTLYVPAFPIAEWLIQNWWSLLNELCPWEIVPKSVVDGRQLSWSKRHCLRAADSALLLPRLYLFSDGQSLRAEWQADPSDSLPNMPGEFVTGGAEQLDSIATEESFSQFISGVLGRVAGLDDERTAELSDQWRAIQNADDEEREFCTIAGRMGLDPYHRNEMTDALALFLDESNAGSQEPLLLRDLTEVAQPDTIKQQWSWIGGATRDLGLGPRTVEPPFELPSRRLSPPEFGYRLAHDVRAAVDRESEPLKSVEEAAEPLFHGGFRVEDRNHIPGQGILAVVGQSRSGDVVAAGPVAGQHPNSQRFLVARSLYHALVTSGVSQRLVTRSYSWDQKASRAFAAELLAPQRALVNRLGATSADLETIESLGREFGASAILIEKQLVNAGIPLSYE
jgi:hypothetical protein